MRHTECTPNLLNGFKVIQAQLEAMWQLIEDNYEEQWHVERNGAVVLDVDDDLLEKICADFPETAGQEFGAYEQHNPEYQKWEWLHLPWQLKGRYVIWGIYSGHGVLLKDGKRRYQFVQEGF